MTLPRWLIVSSILALLLVAGSAQAINYKEIRANPERAEVGEDINVDVLVENTNEEDNFELNLLLNGAWIDTKNVTLSQGIPEWVGFHPAYTPVETGIHRFSVGTVSVDVTVVETAALPAPGLLAVLGAGVAGATMRSRRR